VYKRQNDKIIVLFWDEFTLFLNDLADNNEQSAQDAMTLLDRLRAARVTCPAIRMVYTGSIGLDEVIRRLRKHGYTNNPTNDMAKEILPLLDGVSAKTLAERLLASFEEDTDVRDRLSAHIALICEGHPFLIQHVTDKLRLARQRNSPAAAEAALETLLEEASDPLELSHYLTRLQHYFSEDEHELSLVVLDLLAVSDEPVSLDDLRVQIGNPNRNTLLEVLRVLRRDLYLRRESGMWSFSFSFLRRYWML